MAVVVPLAAAAFTASAGMAAIATGTLLGTISGYAMVAGAVLTGVGALTGKKDLMKAGSILSLAGGVGSLANSAMNAASSSAASSAASELGKDVLQNGALASAEAAGGASSLMDTASSSLMGQGSVFGPASSIGGGGTALTAPWSSGPLATAGAPASSSLMDAAKNLTSNDVSSFLGKTGKKAGELLGKTGEFVKQNKELVNIVGGGLEAAYGPEAEMVDLRKAQVRNEQALIERAQRNLNNPVKLYNYGGGT